MARKINPPSSPTPPVSGTEGAVTLLQSAQQGVVPGVTGQLLSFVVSFIPIPLVLFAGIVFALFHVLETYMTAETAAVDTRLRAAKASIEESKGRAGLASADDSTIRL